MFNGKMKAVTFSYDDGVLQDKRLIEILDKYGLKCTFNINSSLLGTHNSLVREDVTVGHSKPRACEVKEIYKNHEVAVHTLTHPTLKELSDAEIICEVEYDRVRLSEIVGYNVVGMAYPGGTHCIDERVARVIRENTGVKYARTTTSTYNFDLKEDLIMFNPTVYHHAEWDKMEELAKEFIALKPDKPQIFYIWGHAYEFDIHNDWDRFEKFCALISGHDDIFYGTNTECLLAKHE